MHGVFCCQCKSDIKEYYRPVYYVFHRSRVLSQNSGGAKGEAMGGTF